MKMIKLVAAGLLAAAVPQIPAHGAMVIDQGDTGISFNVDYTGMIGTAAISGLSALQNFVFTGASNGGRTYNFSYALTNDSTTTSQLRSFGFDVVSPGTISSLSTAGTYNSSFLTPVLADVLGTREACFAATSFLGTCAAGSSAASSAIGQTGSGTFALTFASAMSSISLDNFAVQFQSITPTVGGLSSVMGTGSVLESPIDAVSAAPEPATWAMMLIGFGFIGAALRRRLPARWSPMALVS